MPPVRLKHVERARDRHGRVAYWYFRDRAGGGPRLPLRGPEGSPEFLADYQAALAQSEGAGRAVHDGATGTIGWLVRRYYRSSEYLQLTPGTRRQRQSILTRFCAWRPRQDAPTVGERPFATLRPAHLRIIRDAMAATPSAANNMLKVVRTLYAFACRYELATLNPASQVERLTPPNPDGHHTWTRAEIAKFEARWPIGTRERLAMALLLYTGRRRSDVVRLGPRNASDGWLQILEQKRGQGQRAKLVEIPIVPALAEVLASSSTGADAYMVTAQGQPFSPDGFGNWFRDACRAAGLPHCSAHGLRKALMTLLAEGGATAHQVQAMGGWTSLAEPTRYTRAADRRRLNAAAAELLAAAFSQTAATAAQTPENTAQKQRTAPGVVIPTGRKWSRKIS